MIIESFERSRATVLYRSNLSCEFLGSYVTAIHDW